MYEFKDPTGITRIAIGFLLFYLAATLLAGLLSLSALLGSPPPSDLGLGVEPGFAGDLVLLVATVACYFVVGFWIYRASANAHALANDLTITPGWAVGWFFIPIANLFKPYQAMKEAWTASHFGAQGDATPLLGVWWALWLASSFLAQLSTRWGEQYEPSWLDVASGAADVALTLVLITLMRRLAAAQLATFRWDVFA